MTTVTIDLPHSVYERLRSTAEQQGKAIEVLVQEWISEKSAPLEPVATERAQLRAALRAAGLLAEPSQEMQQIAAQSTLSLEEAREILDRADGKPLSEVILAMRGPKA